jgi:hypothetical protein
MKHLKSCTAAVLALLAADAAFAQTTIRVTGSTAFRSATVTSIKNLLAGNPIDSAFSGTADSSAQYSTFRGTYAGNAVVIQCSWTGSVEGVRDVSEGLNQTFIKNSAVPNTNGNLVADTLASVSTTNLANTAIYETAVPQISLADNTQSATIYTANGLTETKVGVIPYEWVKGRVGASHPAKAAFDGVTNITAQMAKALLAGGAPVSFLSGTADTTSTKVYAMGRNPLSGTRLVTFAESGFGSASDAIQVTSVISGSNITGISYTADDLVNGFINGNNGYTSGGTLVGDLSKTVSDVNGAGNGADAGQPFALVGYVGVGDAATLIKNINGGTATDVSSVLAYNGASLGVTYNSTTQTTTWDFTAIKEGKYSLWSFAYLAYKPTLSGLPKTFADALSDNIILNVPSATGVKLADMKVTREFEGAVITQ